MIFEGIEAKLDEAAAETKAARAEIAEQRLERKRSDMVVKIALVLALILLVGNLISNVQQYQQTQKSEEAREGSRQILRTLLAYANPESPEGKAQAASTAAFIQELVDKFEAAVRQGTAETTRGTLEIRRCANGPLPEFEDCIRARLPAEAIPDDEPED